MLDDQSIVALYWERNPDAISNTDTKYGSYFRAIANRILKNFEDTEECVNDSYLKTWNTLPPQRPDSLQAYVGRITRNLSLDRYRYNHASKRMGEMDVLYSELDECIPDSARTEDAALGKEVSELVGRFVKSLPERKRIIFIRRYWYACSIAEIAESLQVGEPQIKTILFRLRKDLQKYLAGEGYSI